MRWQGVSSRATKNGGGNEEATLIADEMVGVGWEQRLEKARTGELDEVYNGALRAATHSRRIRKQGSDCSIKTLLNNNI